MKKIIGFLVLVCFLVASHMQLVHAVEMQNQIMYKGHKMHNMNASIFCDTSKISTTSECYKTTLGDISNIIDTQKESILSKVCASILPIMFQYDISRLITTIYTPLYIPPNIVFQKTEYLHLTGIIKSTI